MSRKGRRHSSLYKHRTAGYLQTLGTKWIRGLDMICLVFIRLDSTSGRVSVRVDANPRTGITGI
jgi:hypothetical protein